MYILVCSSYSDLTWEEFKAAKLMVAQNCSATHHTPVNKMVKLPSPAAVSALYPSQTFVGWTLQA